MHGVDATHSLFRGAIEKSAWDVQMRISRCVSGASAKSMPGLNRSVCVDIAALGQIPATTGSAACDRPLNRTSAVENNQRGVSLRSRIFQTPKRTNRFRALDCASSDL